MPLLDRWKPAVEIVWEDGWTRRHDRGFIVRRNPDHIQRAIAAIHRRYERDSDVVGMKELME